MRHTLELPTILSGRGQIFQEDRSPIDVRYQIVLALSAAPPVPVASASLAAHGRHTLPEQTTWGGTLVVLNRADIWRIDLAAEYQLTLANGRRCRVALHHDPHQPFTKYGIVCHFQDLV